jgi:hypothetical protein
MAKWISEAREAELKESDDDDEERENVVTNDQQHGNTAWKWKPLRVYSVAIFFFVFLFLVSFNSMWREKVVPVLFPMLCDSVTPCTSTIINDMQTRSSPPQSTHSDSDHASQAVTGANAPVHWTEVDESALVDFLIAHKAEGGDGMNFKPSVWSAAAEHMRPLTTKGGPKNARKCKAKWHRVHLIHFGYFY